MKSVAMIRCSIAAAILLSAPAFAVAASMGRSAPLSPGVPTPPSHWSDKFYMPGPDGDIRAFTTFDGALYAGGNFHSIGPVRAPGIARFDGSSWTDVGGGISGGYVAALVEFRGELIAAGSFSNAGDAAASGIARWDGIAWRSVEGAAITNFTSLVVRADTLYAAGFAAGSVVVQEWDGTSWSRLGVLDTADGYLPDTIQIAWYNGQLYAGGLRILEGGQETRYAFVSRWDGVNWIPLDPAPPFGTFGLGPLLFGLQVVGDRLYATGNDLVFGDTSTGDIASYDGSTWSEVDGLSSPQHFEEEYMTCVLPYQGGFLIGGSFSGPGNGSSLCIAYYGGSSWSPLPGGGLPGDPYGDGADGSVGLMSEYAGNVYVAGSFDAVANGAVHAQNLARWDGSAWSTAVQGGEGFRGSPGTVAIAGDSVIVGGNFTDAGSAQASDIALWDGSSWRPLGSGLDGEPDAILPNGHGIVVAGIFSHAGGVSVSNIAAYDFRTGAWSGLGNPPQSTRMMALTTYDGDLIAGGYYAGSGATTPVLARWDGSSWGAMANVPLQTIASLETSHGILFAAGSTPNSYLATAVWDGHAWTVFSDVGAPLAIFRGDLYSSGFWASGYHGGLLRWNGASFTPIPMGGESSISSLTVCGDRLVAAGSIQGPSGNLYPLIAYDGSTWTAFEEGPPSGIWEVAGNATTLAVVGTFTTAAGMGSHRIAIWHDELPVAPYLFQAAREDTTVRITFDVDAPGATYRLYGGPLQQEPSLLTDSLFTGSRDYEFVDRAHPTDATEYSLEQVDRSGMRIALFGPVRVPALAAQVADISAERGLSAIRLEWSVDSEHPGAIFKVYRESDSGGRLPLDITPEQDSTRTRYSALDPAPPSDRAAYWLEEVSSTGRSIAWTGPVGAPSTRDLWGLRSLSVLPNPTSNGATFTFSLPARTEADISLYDLGGRRVASLPPAILGVGPQAIPWDGRGLNGRPLPQGIYLARLRTAAGERSARVIVLR